MNRCSSTLTLFAALALPLSIQACATEGGDALADSTKPGGKADGFGDSCPADVQLNSARGSAKRCTNADNGQFVETACCVDECAGAGWREQSNGLRCAWLAEPGTDGASVGQFAPRTCCDLNDALACGRATQRDGACVDAEDPDAVVAAACCESAPSECSPVVRSGLRECVDELRWDAIDDPELPLGPPLQALEACATEGDLTGRMRDRICEFNPDSTVCDVSIEDFHQDFVGACFDAIRPEFDCALGLTFRDIRHPQSNLVIFEESVLHAEDIGTLTDAAAAQIRAAHALRGIDGVDSLEAVFDNVDSGVINYLVFWDGSNGRAYAAVEFGLGDNGFGAVFEHGTSTVAVEIQDSDLYAPTSGGAYSCGPTVGPMGNDCGASSDCAAGLQCTGSADVPGLGRVGKCVDAQLGADSGSLDAECSAADDCPFEAGLVCSGLGATTEDDDFGFCRGIWSRTLLRDDAIISIPDGDEVDRTVIAYGLATVPEDAILRLEIEHEDFAQIQVLMDDAGGEDFVTVFDGSDPAQLAALPQTSGAITLVRDVPHSGDDEVNGAWTLRVVDTAAGQTGAILQWELQLTSRFD